MDNPKYVIIEERGIENAVILNNALSHDCLNIHSYRVVSAGFFGWETDKDECGNGIIKSKAFGKSVSLGKSSRPQDSILIDKTLNWWNNY